MKSRPFLDEKSVPLNCIPICPSFHQVLSAEKNFQLIKNRGGNTNSLKAEAFLAELDRIASGVLNSDEMLKSPQRECLSGKMYFVVELLKQLEDRKAGYMMITIITGRPDVEEALVKVLNHYLKSQVVRVGNISLRGHSDGVYIGGVTVHIKSDDQQAIMPAAQSDLVLIYDGDLIGANFARVFVSFPFDMNPSILSLFIMGSPEARLRNYFNQYTAQHKINPYTTHLEELFVRDASRIAPLLSQENDVFTDEEFKLWNDTVALQVLNWIIYGSGNDYKFKTPLFPNDVPSKYFQPPF